jgi:hypothetical protein
MGVESDRLRAQRLVSGNVLLPSGHVRSFHASPWVLAAGLVSAAGWALAAEQALAAKQIPCMGRVI